MPEDTMWVETYKALDDFFQTLTCKTCKNTLEKPQQLLNCGHYSCAKCIGRDSNCTQCKIPGQATDVHSDTAMNDLIFNLNIIAQTVGFKNENPNPKDALPTINNEDDCSKSIKSIKSNRSIRRKNAAKSKVLDETMSVCESTISRITFRGKNNEVIPKNINKKNKKGETALHIACRSDNRDRVKLLLEAQANPNTKDNAGWTPMQEAASFGFYEVCEMLLKAGASPDTPGFDNRTALHDAVMIDDCNLVALLLNHNAKTNVFDNVGKKPKNYCKTQEIISLFKRLENVEENRSEISEPSRISENMDKTLNHTICESKIVLYGSNLNPNNRKLLHKLGADKKLKVANYFSSLVSHVITETDATGNVRLTLDLLFTILYGKILLSSDCFPILMESENITVNDFIPFEVNPVQLDDGLIRARENIEKQNPKLFNNCHFYFSIKKNSESIEYDDMSITKDDLMKLVAAGDGIVLTREPKPEDTLGSLSPFHVAHNPKHSLHKCTHYIIYIPEDSNPNSNTNRIIYNMSTLKTLPLIWFIESILRFKLLDPIDLGLAS